MKKFVVLILTLLLQINLVFAFPIDTTGWACNPEHINVTASELDLKSDLKSDFRLFQATVKNISTSDVEVVVPSNKDLEDEVQKLLNTGLTVKELVELPRQIAVDCYNEDVGEGKIANAHKGLINVLGTAGAVVAGAGMMGIYPSQKIDEYFSHKKIKKEYKKYSKELVSEFVLSPNASYDLIIFVPINTYSCIIKTKLKDSNNEVYSDYHQL